MLQSRIASCLVLLTLSACGSPSDTGTSDTTSTGGTASSSGGVATAGSGTGGHAAGGSTAGTASSLMDCNSALRPRRIAFQFESNEAPVTPPFTTPEDVDAAGTLTDVALSTEPCALCETGSEPGLRLTLTTIEGVLLTLVLSPEGALQEWRDLAEASLGETLSLSVRYKKIFQSPVSSGFILSDAAGVVMAAEAGPWVKTLTPTDLPALEVLLGADVCRQTSSSCSLVVESELVFSADTSVSVGPTRDEEFVLGGRDYFARNVSGGRLIQSTTCSDLEHVSSWAIWRKP